VPLRSIILSGNGYRGYVWGVKDSRETSALPCWWSLPR